MKKRAKQRRAGNADKRLRPSRTNAKAKSMPKRKLTREELEKPKKPPTAFFYFLDDFRKGYQEEHPDVKTMRDIGKACGEKWKTMTYEEKVKYYDIATEKRKEFEEAMAAYMKKKENGDYLQQSDDNYEEGD